MELPPEAQLVQYITGHWVAAATYTAARLGLADHLKDGPRSSDEVAREVNAHGSSLYRLMRALASLGVFQEVEPRRFALTEIGQFLRSDHPRSMRNMALFQGAPPHWQGWGSFLHSVQTGGPAFDHVHGMGFFDYCRTDADFSEAFNGAMSGMTAASTQAVIEAYDFTGIKQLADVGGGHGLLLGSILQRYPALKGVLFDLPHVVKGAPEMLETLGVADRCRIEGGDFFNALPTADAYIAKHIIHDWDDEHARRILNCMRESMSGQGKVLLIEAVVRPGNEPSFAKLVDLEMLHATHGGRERTEEEFCDLLASAGLRLSRIVPTASLFSIVEAARE